MTEQAAYEFVESRLWPTGPVCPRCKGQRAGKLTGDSTRIGVYKCYACRKPFNVKIGTIFEKSHIPLASWIAAIEMLKNKTSARTMSAKLGMTHTSAWRMTCRLREALKDGGMGALLQ